jgi:hypothetical protein
VHPVHFGLAAPLADHPIVFRAARPRFRLAGRRRRRTLIGHGRHYIHIPKLIRMEKLHSVRLLSITIWSVLIENADVVQ